MNSPHPPNRNVLSSQKEIHESLPHKRVGEDKTKYSLTADTNLVLNT